MLSALISSALTWACLLSAAPAQSQEINTQNANFYVSHVDLRIQRPGVPLELERHYNSRSTDMGLFGYGWSTPYDVVLGSHADGTLLVVDADGYVIRYTLDGRPWSAITEDFVGRLVEARRTEDRQHGSELSSQAYRDLGERWLENPAEREQATWLYPSAWGVPSDGEYHSSDRGFETIVMKSGIAERRVNDGSLQVFDDRGRLTGLKDPAGRGVRLDYDRDGRLYKVAHTDGGGFTLIHGPDGKVAELRDTEGRRVEYGYDEDGNLLQVKGPGKRLIAYAYDEEHNMVALRRPDGTGLQILYDKERDWAVAMKEGELVTRYAWRVLDPHGQHVACVVTHPDGATTRHEYDDVDNVALEEGPEGTTRTVFSPCCEKPLEVTDPTGAVTRYDYDQYGRLVAVTAPDGTRGRYTYHPTFNRILNAAFSDGRRFEYTYDDGGRVVMVRAVDGTILELIYGPNGKASEVTSSSSGKYRFVYDTDGRPVRITGRRGVSLELEYGATGALVTSHISTPSSGQKASFYKELQHVLAMLEPAAGHY